MKKITFIALVISVLNVFSQTIDPGNTSGQLDVSLTGGATYSIPISTPPGIKDVVPQIGLAYSSQAGPGLAGWGWNITGLSAISRIPETTFHDGEIDGVDFDLKDRYALDGQRLILVSGTYGVAGSVYVTENYSNVKVKAFGVHPSGATYGPLYFEVYYPNGNIATYGNYSSSTSKLSWAISRWKDPQGNTINYTYSNYTEPRLITDIKYGSGNNSTTGINGIYFTWETRNRNEVNLIGGVNTVLGKRLKNIAVQNNSTLLRQYDLTYSTSTDPNFNNLYYDRLKSIQEKNGEGHLLNPINFEYDQASTNLQNVTHMNEISYDQDDFSKYHVVSGDFDLSGKIDIGYYKNGDNKVKIYKDGNFSTYQLLNTSSNLYTDTYSSNIFTSSLLEGGKLKGKQYITIKKMGTSNVTFQHYAISSSTPQLIGTNTFNLETYTTEDCDGSITNIKPIYFQEGDFNGDGITDLLGIHNGYDIESDCYLDDSDPYSPGDYSCVCHNYQTVTDNRVFLYNLKDNSSQLIGNDIDHISVGNHFMLGEFNGDGKQDLFVYKEGKIAVYGLNSNNVWEKFHEYNDPLIYKKFSDQKAIDKNTPIVFGDYNGDGLTDAIIPNGYSWRVLYSNGKTFTIGSYYNGSLVYYNNYQQSDYSYYKNYYIATDLNADGKSDLIYHRTKFHPKGWSQYEYLRTFINQGITTGYSFTTNLVYDYSDEGHNRTSALGIPVFVNSNYVNNANEYAYISYYRTWDNVGGNDEVIVRHYFATSNIRPNFLLKKVTNNSVTTTINYGTLTPDNTSYVSDISEVYPNVNVNFSPTTYLVKSITEIGAGITKTQDFRYRGFVTNVQGLGFLGPKEHKRSSWYGSGVGKIWSISLHDISKRGAVTSQYTSLTDTGYLSNFISRTQNQYSTTLGVNKVFTNLPTQIVQTDALQGITTTTTNAYDSYNNVAQTLTTFTGGSKKVVMQYSNQTATLNNTYHVGRPIQKVETSTLGSDVFAVTEAYAYTNNLLTQSKKKANTTNWVTENFEYDSFGNVKKRTLSATGIANRVENFEYDTSGRFVIKSYDIQGLMTQYDYNTTYGSLTSETNPYGLVTSYQYDGWGRMTQSTDYLGNATHYSIVALSGGGIRKTVDYPSGPDEVTEYNAFGWELNKKVLALNGNWVKNSINYDILGRKTAVSEPYFDTSSPSQWTTSEFDVYGRPIKITEPTGKITTTQFNGLTVTVNDGVKTVSTSKDAAGNILTMTDPGGTVTYTYYANGTMKTANYGGHIVSTQIDGWGRKSSLTDPDAGTYTYQYNDIGELLVETTPKGTTTYAYDNYGKLLHKSIVGDATDIHTTYSYNSTTKLLNQIQGVNNIDGNSKAQSIVHDEYKRISEVYESSASEGTNYSKKLKYDTFGRISTTEYNTSYQGQTAQVRLVNNYDNSGVLTRIIDNNTGQSLWVKNNENARGQMLSTTLGNGVTKTRTYNNYGFPTAYRDNKGTQSVLMLDYSFNAQRGLLTYRNNGNFSTTEYFTYDAQERLSQISGSVNFTQNYDNRGRITQNSNVGTYNYNGNNYQLTDISLNTAGTTYYQNHSLQEAEFNAFKKPISIWEAGQGRMYFEYDPITLERTATYFGLEDNNKQSIEYIKYFSSIIPVEITKERNTGKIKIITFVGGDAYSAPMMHVKRNGTAPLNTFFYLHRDYLGSILAITDQNAHLVERRQFGAWGTIDKFWNSAGDTEFNFNTTLLDRGYTGHEHLFFVSLINMNGRLYDAKLGRFLSPDNFVQDPYNTQNFNRYGYVVNNPLSFSDESGEFIFTILAAITDIIGNVVKHGVNFNNYNWHRTEMGWKIDTGLFRTDTNKSFFGRVWELITRFTWQLPQTILGYTSTGVHNTLGGVKSVTFYGGTTVAESYSESWGGITLGNYINGQRGTQANPTNRIFQHEYGHYIQSQKSGLFYLSKYGIPSLLSKDPHKNHPAEQDANIRAFMYFNKHIENYSGWVHTGPNANRINGYNWDLSYNDPSNQLTLNNGILSLKWYDFLMGPQIIIPGIVNAIILNKQY